MAIKLLKLLREKNADLIISTHPFSSQMCSYLKRKGKINSKIATIMTAVAAGEQIALEHALADVLGEHGVHDAAVGGEVVVDVARLAVPGAVGYLKDGGEAVRGRLVGPEDAEVALRGVEAAKSEKNKE